MIFRLRRRNIALSAAMISVMFAACSYDSNADVISDKPILFQNYKINATRDMTDVQASVFFRDRLYNAVGDIIPNSVSLNGLELEKTRYRETGTKHDFRNLLKSEMDKPKDSQLLIAEAMEVDGYSISVPKFTEQNVFNVVAPNGEVRSLSLELSPFEFDRSKPIVLQRNQDNVLHFTGGSEKADKKFTVGVAGEPDFQENLVRIDFDKRTITIPRKAMSSVSLGQGKLYGISSSHSYLNEPISRNGFQSMIGYISSFQFVYKAELDITIVD